VPGIRQEWQAVEETRVNVGSLDSGFRCGGYGFGRGITTSSIVLAGASVAHRLCRGVHPSRRQMTSQGGSCQESESGSSG
jgi:hypothetical protein